VTWENIQSHEASRGLSATYELLVLRSRYRLVLVAVRTDDCLEDLRSSEARPYSSFASLRSLAD